MPDQANDHGQSPEEIQAFLQRLSRDKRAVAAHLGIRVERDFSVLAENERLRDAARKADEK